MLVVLTSIAVVFAAALVNIMVVPQVLKTTAGAGVMVSGGGDSGANSIPAFLTMFALLIGWAYACFVVAEWLAGEDIGQRWVLLIVASGLAGAPYVLYRRRVDNLGTVARLVPPLHSALEYAGGIQSKVVVAGMISGIWYDWWEHLPG